MQVGCGKLNISRAVIYITWHSGPTTRIRHAQLIGRAVQELHGEDHLTQILPCSRGISYQLLQLYIESQNIQCATFGLYPGLVLCYHVSVTHFHISFCDFKLFCISLCILLCFIKVCQQQTSLF